MPYPTTQASVQCPQCNQSLTMTVQQIIDVGEEPTLRDRLLRGKLNVLHCTNCGASGPIAAPMVYHDPEHELLLAFMPQALQLTMEQEEQEVGRLTNMVLENTPAEQRKSYLLDPVRVMTYDGLVEKIMEAAGVDPEQMRKQTEKIQLVMQLAQAVGDDEKLSALIEEHKKEIDYDFLMLITVTMQQATEVEDEATVERYGTLREKIIEQLDFQPDQVPSLGQEEQMDALIDALLEVPEEQFETAVADKRPLLDYNFFMHLSQRAENSSDAEKEKLLALRSRLVELTEKMDSVAQEAMQRAAKQLNELLEAEDIDAKIQELYHELDEAFLVVLSANVEEAKTQGRDEIVEVLTRIYSRVVQAMESRLRPELRAVNQMLRMESSEERKARLREELQTYNPAGFIEMVETIAGDLEDSGRSQPEVLDRLYTIADEARQLMAAGEVPDHPAPKEPLFNQEQADEEGQSGIILP